MLQVERHNEEVQQAELPLIHSSRATISSGGIHRLRRKGNLAGSLDFKRMHTRGCVLFSEKPWIKPSARIEVSLGKTITFSRKQHPY